MLTTSRHIALIAVTAAVTAAAPAQARPAFDPGISDAAQGNATSTSDYRSLDGAVPVEDARGEAARSAGRLSTPVVVEVGPDQGLDWGAVGLGAGGGLALAAMSAGGMLLSRRVRTTRVVV